MILTIKALVEGRGDERLDARYLCIKLRNIVGTVSKDLAGLYLNLIEVKITRKQEQIKKILMYSGSVYHVN
ncbi:hypothetical protein SAMN06272722_102324 [Paenibacillus sp. RU5A]|nr:hypothetical protein SAMN06272722_102324 [Paenibacillus sp. RU5A]SOC67191.1 hypothetical protein SAMN05880581_102674 [Paenibacillus sp. RU26A]SOC69558.1 hypothetical protein SAMN05880586_102324 [Paenibacillus sp. RU5M]